MKNENPIAHYHLPGLFEFYDLYRVFLPIYREHPGFFYDWCDIASIYGAPSDCLWSGGRLGGGDCSASDVLELLSEYGISGRLTFSNSLLDAGHLQDRKCNALCELFEKEGQGCHGVIVHSDLLLNFLKERYPGLYFVSSTTKVLTTFEELKAELKRDEFSFVVPDFRLNKQFDDLGKLPDEAKSKVEFLCNECCNFECPKRRECYENVSRIVLGTDDPNRPFVCSSSTASEGYRFSKAMRNPGFIGIDDIRDTYLKMGFSNFKIEGRSLGSALILEFLLYYMTRPERQLEVREMIYLDNELDLF